MKGWRCRLLDWAGGGVEVCRVMSREVDVVILVEVGEGFVLSEVVRRVCGIALAVAMVWSGRPLG